MYVTQEIAERIKLQAKLKGVAIKDLLADCDMNINAISQFSKGKQMSCTSLALVADYLDCSVDYLLGRKLEANGESVLAPEEAELLRLYRKADVNGQFKIIAAAMNATGKKEKPHLVPGTAIAAYGGGVISDPPVEDDIIT